MESRNFQEQIESMAQGVAIKNMASVKILKEIQVPTPALSEQKRIVAILDQSFADIDKARVLTEQNLKNARELFDSYLQQVFSQSGDGWSQRTLGELGKVSMCKRILKKQTTESGDIPFYKIGTFGKKPDAYISQNIYDDFRAKYSFPKRGDILISASGTIGRRVVYDGEPAYFQDSNIVWIDNDESLVLNNYLYHFYGVCDWNPSKGATISRLYNDDLRSIKISFPSVELQKRYVDEIIALNRQADDLQSLYKKKLAALDELKKSLLQKAFSGELTKDKLEAA
jgi:type I restriction enzyme S subunit